VVGLPTPHSIRIAEIDQEARGIVSQVNALNWAGVNDRKQMIERLEARLEGFCDMIQRAAVLAGRK
jgi:hypothetical protein